MKKVNIGFCVSAVILFLFGCQQDKRESNDSVVEKNMLSTEKTDGNQRQFIHTASLNMSVSDCLQATALIEQQAISNKGFVLKSEVNKNITQQVESILSADSIKQLTYFTTTANIILRIPDTSLQAFLAYTQGLSTHVKSRLIEAEDVSFDLKLNQLNLQTGNKNQSVVSTNSDDKIETKTLTNNQSVVENLRIKDAIHFSTISISILQPEEILSNVLINTNASWARETPILNKAWYSLQKGFYYFSEVIIFLLQLWWVLPLYIFGKYVFIKSKKLFFSKS